MLPAKLMQQLIKNPEFALDSLEFPFNHAGNFSRVFRETPDTIIKVVTQEDRGYEAFADYCEEHRDNKYLPNVERLNENVFRMPVYQAFSREKYWELSSALSALGNLGEIDEYFAAGKGSDFYWRNCIPNEAFMVIYSIYQIQKDCCYNFEVLEHAWNIVTCSLGSPDHDLYVTVRQLIHETQGQLTYMIDLHNENWMITREGDVIIIDPWADVNT